MTLSVASPNRSIRRKVVKHATQSRGGIVVTHNRLASTIAARVLADGGHAVDAAVAASFAVGVLEPWMSGIGGIGAMLVRLAGDDKVVAIDAGARTPLALDPADYPLVGGLSSEGFGWPRVKDDRNLVGVMSAVAPALVAGVAAAHKRFGRKPWRDLVAPSIDAAREGPVVDWSWTLNLAGAFRDLSADSGCRAAYLPGGVPPTAPAATAQNPIVRLPNAALARTLGEIAEGGADAFYRGPIAKALVDDLRAAGGAHTLKDFETYDVRIGEAQRAALGDRVVHVVPGLNGGPTVADALGFLAERLPLAKVATPLDAAAFTAIAASLRAAWEKRFATMGDAAQIAPQGSTTHLCVVDRDGNMVTLTQTLLSLFGARYLSPSTGILMNNAMNWCDPREGSPNGIAPGRRVLSNYAPAVMTHGDDAVAIGGSGGRKILPAVFQLLVMMAAGASLDDAMHAPRIDVSGGEHVVVDRDLPADVRAALAAAFSVRETERVNNPFDFTIASAVRRRGRMSEGATEPHHPWSEAVAEDEV